MTPRTGDDAGLRAFVDAALLPLLAAEVKNASEYTDVALTAVRSWDEANAGGVPVAGWVKCSERMPDEGVCVLVKLSSDGELTIMRKFIDTPHRIWGRGWHGPGFSLLVGSAIAVTHWMPLPPSPGEAAAPVRANPMSAQDVLDLRRKELDEAWGAGFTAGQSRDSSMFALVQGTVPRDLAEDVAMLRHRAAAEGAMAPDRTIADGLTRLGWVHSSQATGGGLSGEARETIELALEHAHDTAAGEDERDAVAAARAEIAAPPVRRART